MQAGLVGFSGSGKSTLFQLLTGATPDPGKVQAGQVGIAVLNDPRIDVLAEMYRPKKITRANVEILDTPGLMPGSHGDNPQRLGPDPQGRRPGRRPQRLRPGRRPGRRAGQLPG